MATATKKADARALPRLKAEYRKEIAPALQKEFGFSNPMQVPGLTKIVVNMGVGQAAKESKLIEGAVRDLTAITGQKPQVNLARKSIAQFKLREGQAIGAHVTIRGDRMWEFLDRLLNLALPRIRDFRGLSAKQFDGNGNYTFGLSEQSMFHEIDQDTVDDEVRVAVAVVKFVRVFVVIAISSAPASAFIIIVVAVVLVFIIFAIGRTRRPLLIPRHRHLCSLLRRHALRRLFVKRLCQTRNRRLILRLYLT